MTLMTMWAFQQPDAAQRAERVLGTLSAGGELEVLDGIVLGWPAQRDAPQPRRLQSIAIVDAFAPAFWGLLLGAVFFAPGLSEVSRVDPDALTGMLTGVGLDGDFVVGVRDAVTPGGSAIILATEADPDTADRALAELNPRRVTAHLSAEQHQALHDVFVGRSVPSGATDLGDRVVRR